MLKSACFLLIAEDITQTLSRLGDHYKELWLPMELSDLSLELVSYYYTVYR